MKYAKPNLASAIRFTKSPIADVEFSKLSNNPRTYTTYNAGDIVPILCQEVLPHSTFSVDIDFINRLLSPTIHPTMGTLQLDIWAYFVPNRVVNESWKNVEGENSAGYWTTPDVQLAPLWTQDTTVSNVQIPVGSVADYYGFPTQAPIPVAVLQQCHDLKFRGYIECYNRFFRDQNHMSPISYSKLNLFNGFLQEKGSMVGLAPEWTAQHTQIRTLTDISKNTDSSGEYGQSAIVQKVYGEGSPVLDQAGYGQLRGRLSNFSALDKPLKACKLHDMFTSGLPSPQKGAEVFFTVTGEAPIIADSELHDLGLPLKLTNFAGIGNGGLYLSTGNGQGTNTGDNGTVHYKVTESFSDSSDTKIEKTNLIADLSKASGVSVSELRNAVAVQQIYEALARGGSRYLEVLRTLFNIEAESPFKDEPTQLGHIVRELDMYQVAQTSATVEGDTAQGNLSGYGYTNNGGDMFTYTSLEHGYIHYFACVRHRNIYSTYFAPDNFRMNMLDFYMPQLANISEQPLRKALLNPFKADSMEKSMTFQEAWVEYRYTPDQVTGYCRTGITGNLDKWTYADDYDPDFSHVNGEWLLSNTQEVLDRTLQVTSDLSPQFIAMFEFKITKQIPMPTYSVPGMDLL